MVPHASILAGKPLDDWQPVAAAALQHPQVTAAVPFTELEGMLSFKGAMQPIQISGIDPQLEPQVSIIAEHMQQGRLADLQPGEFGVVLMIGGNIPGATRVVSVQIYDHVEAMEYAQAHWLDRKSVV